MSVWKRFKKWLNRKDNVGKGLTTRTRAVRNTSRNASRRASNVAKSAGRSFNRAVTGNSNGSYTRSDGTKFTAKQESKKTKAVKPKIKAAQQKTYAQKKVEAAVNKKKTNELKAVVAKSQEQQKKNQNGMTNNEVAVTENLSRMNPQIQTTAVKELEEKGNKNAGIEKGYATRLQKAEEKSAKENPFLYNFIRKSSPVDTKSVTNRITKNATGKDINTKKADKTVGGKVGSVAGTLAQYAITGGPLEGSIGSGIAKGVAKKIATKKATQAAAKGVANTAAKKAAQAAAKKTVSKAIKGGKGSITVNGTKIGLTAGKKANFAARRVADVVAGAPLNASMSASESKNKGEFVKNMAINTGMDVAGGAGFEVAGKAIKGIGKFNKGLKDANAKISDVSSSKVNNEIEKKVSHVKAKAKKQKSIVAEKVSSGKMTKAEGAVQKKVIEKNSKAEIEKIRTKTNAVSVETPKNENIAETAKKQGSDVSTDKSLDVKGTTAPKAEKTAVNAQEVPSKAKGEKATKAEVKTETKPKTDNIPDWIVDKNLNEGEAFAFKNASDRKIVKETDNAVLVEADTDYGKSQLWVPKSQLKSKPTTKAEPKAETSLEEHIASEVKRTQNEAEIEKELSGNITTDRTRMTAAEKSKLAKAVAKNDEAEVKKILDDFETRKKSYEKEAQEYSEGNKLDAETQKKVDDDLDRQAYDEDEAAAYKEDVPENYNIDNSKLKNTPGGKTAKQQVGEVKKTFEGALDMKKKESDALVNEWYEKYKAEGATPELEKEIAELAPHAITSVDTNIYEAGKAARWTLKHLKRPKGFDKHVRGADGTLKDAKLQGLKFTKNGVDLDAYFNKVLWPDHGGPIKYADNEGDQINSLLDAAELDGRHYAGEDMDEQMLKDTYVIPTLESFERAAKSEGGYTRKKYQGFSDEALEGDKEKYVPIDEETRMPKAETVKTETKTEEPKTEVDKAWEQAQKENPTYKNGTPSNIDGLKQPKTVDTAMGKNGIVDNKAVQQEVKSDLLANELGYKQEKMSDVSSKAKAAVAENADKAYKDLMLSTKGSSRDIAMAAELYNHYASIGDIEKASMALEKASELATEGGRTVNAVKLFMKETPAGRIRTIENLEKKLNEKYSKILDEDVKLSDETRLEVQNAKTEEEIQAANEKAQLELWNQIPATFKEKVDAFRYIAMLGNPKTHIRNIVGNMLFSIPRKGKDMLATAGEKLAIKAGILDEGKGTKALLTSNDKYLVKFGKEQFEDNVDSIRGNSARWYDKERPQESKVYDLKLLEVFRKFNGKALDAEDIAFMKPAYAKTMARYMKARGLKPKDMTGDVLEEANNYATQEALRATYRDFTEIGNWLSKVKNVGPNASVPKKAGAVAVESMIPFAKTPINILRRGIDYSPIGLISGTGKLVKAVKAGDNKLVSEAIDRMSAGLTGTGIFGLGLALNQMGIITTDLGSDAKGKYDKDTGKQGYSINISINIGGHSMTLDWAAPAAIPFFFGAEVGNTIKSGNTNVGTLLDSTGKMLNPVAELSMMQGVTNALQGLKSAKNAGDIIANVGTNIGVNYITQAVPTLLGQLARTIDDTQRSTTSTANSTTGRTLETALLRQKNKIPFLSKTSQPYVDKWGREVESGSVAERIVENFISPAYFSKDKSTKTDKEINRLYGKLGDDEKNSVIPKSAGGYDLMYDGDKVRMSKKDLTTYNKTKGQSSYKMVNALMKTDMYKNMSDDEKASAIASVYTNAGKGAKATSLIGMGKNDVKAMAESYGMGQSTINRLKTYKAKGHNVKDIIGAKQNISMKAQGVNSKAVKAAALLESNANKDMISFFGVKDKVKDVKSYLNNGGSTDELSSVQRQLSKAKKKLPGGRELTQMQKAMIIEQNADSNRVYNLYAEGKLKLMSSKYRNVARGLDKYGITDSDIQSMKTKYDTNGSGRLGKDEASAAAEKLGRNLEEKSVIFDAIANWNSKNPYGSRSFSASKNKSKPKTKTVKYTTTKKVQAPVQVIMRNGDKKDVTHLSKEAVQRLLLNSKGVKAIKYGTVNRKVTKTKEVAEKAKKDNTKVTASTSSSGGAYRRYSSSYRRRGGSGGSGRGSTASANISPAQRKIYKTNYKTTEIHTLAKMKRELKSLQNRKRYQ